MTAIIVDDERLARLDLTRLLRAHPEITLAGEAKNAAEARALIARSAPDVMFLDVQMPGCDGFSLLEQLEIVPAVIFTTAYDAYALKAFEVSAVDYLVKPIVPSRLAAALAKLAQPPPAASPAASLSPRRIFLRDGERCWLVRQDEIIFLESEGNYTRFYFVAEHALIVNSLQYFEARLQTDLFFRASRRHLLQLGAIERLDAWVNGGLLAQLRGGHKVPISRRQTRELQLRLAL